MSFKNFQIHVDYQIQLYLDNPDFNLLHHILGQYNQKVEFLVSLSELIGIFTEYHIILTREL